METGSIKVAIVDDHTLFRNGVANLLQEFNELEIIFEAENGLVMTQLMKCEHLPQVILMDINMPIMDGFTATRWLREHFPFIHVLALTTYEDDISVMKMITAGAVGYILKRSRPRELREAILILHEKGIFFNEILSAKLMRIVAAREIKPVISEKEATFLKYCCSELTYKEIADLMHISPRTIDNYRESLFVKLNIRSRTGLVLYAIKEDIVQL